MSTKGTRTECTVRNDPRLIAGVGAVVSYAAGRAGLVDWDQSSFASAAEEACRETLARLDKTGKYETTVQLAVADFPGRVEVTIEPVADRGARGASNKATVQAIEDACQTLENKGVDRVLCESSPQSFRVKLIKYSSETKSAASD